MTGGIGAFHPRPVSGAAYSAVELAPDDRSVILLDQRRLPLEERYDRLADVEDAALAIERLALPGPPAIRIAAAHGPALAASGGRGRTPAGFTQGIEAAPARPAPPPPTA